MKQNPVDQFGKEWPAQEYHIDSTAIARFTAAVGDANPRWQQIAPPTFATIVGFDRFIEQTLDIGAFDTLLHGKTDLENFLPVRPHDVITTRTVAADVRQRKSKTGSVTFMNFETTYTNQRQELVARCRQLVIGYQGTGL